MPPSSVTCSPSLCVESEDASSAQLFMVILRSEKLLNSFLSICNVSKNKAVGVLPRGSSVHLFVFSTVQRVPEDLSSVRQDLHLCPSFYSVICTSKPVHPSYFYFKPLSYISHLKSYFRRLGKRLESESCLIPTPLLFIYRTFRFSGVD